MFCKKIIFVILFLPAFILLSGCIQRETQPPHTYLLMGTVCTVNLFDEGTEELYSLIQDRLVDIEQTYSVNIPSSAISEINRQAGIAPVEVSDEVLHILETALRFAQITDGAFDPTIGPLVSLWGIGSDHARLPDPDEIEKTLPLVNFRLVQLDKVNKTVFLPIQGMALDLGGIVKGFAADETVAILRRKGVNRALIDLGGNIYAYGSKKDGSPWKIGVRDPMHPESQPVLGIPVSSKSVVTSGTYERYFEKDGVRYHHILNPKTGYPVQSDIISATIVSELSIEADALSTSVFVLGAESGFDLLAKLERTEAACIYPNGNVRATPALQKSVQALSPNYRLIDQP